MCFVHNDSVNITQWNFQMHIIRKYGEENVYGREHNKIYGNVSV